MSSAALGTDFLLTLGPLALTLRLRRLAERLTEDGRRLYGTLETPLQPSWYATLMLLEAHGPLSVVEVAKRLRVRHPSVIKQARALQDAGLILAERDSADRRRRLLRLSDRAMALRTDFSRVWDAFRDELATLTEADGPTILDRIDALEVALDECSLEERVRRHLVSPSPTDRPPPLRADVELRAVAVADKEAVLGIARELVRSGDTYAYPAGIDDEELWVYWTQGHGFVATRSSVVVGMFFIRPNHAGPANHICNASYAVRADVRGLGLGRAMGEESLTRARALGFSAMQFNLVVSTNVRAVRLWRSLGFKVVGTVPRGFRLPTGKLVAFHIMHRSLQ